MSNNKHRVKTHRWENGFLRTLDHWFDSYEQAKLFADNIDVHSLKIYSPENEILDSRSKNSDQSNVAKLPDDSDYSNANNNSM